MSDDTNILLRQLREQGPRQFASWNEDAFECYIDGALENLANRLKWSDKENPDVDTIENFLRLVFEGVGAGWIGPLQDHVSAPTFLAHCLWTVVPYQLGKVPREKRAEVLRRVWNLGEGLAHEPLWLNQYVITRTDWSTDLETIDQHLAMILQPVVAPLPPADWTGKFQLHILNLRQQADSFVPGRMYLASPAVLCIEDRVNSMESLAILLQKSGKSEVLGTVGRLPDYVETFDAPSIQAMPDEISINGQKVAAPLIASPRQTVCVASGFVIVSADDSQRLWLVEAA